MYIITIKLGEENSDYLQSVYTINVQIEPTERGETDAAGTVLRYEVAEFTNDFIITLRFNEPLDKATLFGQASSPEWTEKDISFEYKETRLKWKLLETI